MKFLVDECVGTSVARWFRQNNYDTASVYDGFLGIDDIQVLEKAVSENRILITCDKDFGELIFKNKMQHCGVILLRLMDERPAKKISILEDVLKNYSEEIFGNFVIVTEKTVRINKSVLS